MLIRMNVILWMRHQAQNIALWIADSSNIEEGAVRIDGIIFVGRGAISIDVRKRNLVVFDKRRKRKRFGCLKVSFTMGDRTFDHFVQSFCPNTLLRNRCESYPTTFEMSLLVEG